MSVQRPVSLNMNIFTEVQKPDCLNGAYLICTPGNFNPSPSRLFIPPDLKVSLQTDANSVKVTWAE